MSKEIIVEELKKIHGEYMVAKAKATISGEYYKNEDEWKNKFFEPLASILLSKLKPEGEVIEKGEVKYAENYKAYYIKWDSNEPETSLDAFLSDKFKSIKKIGTKIELVIREDKEE